MKNQLLAIIILLFGVVGCRAKAEDLKSTMLKKGLPAKVTVRVKDPDGKPITNASVMFCFVVHSLREPNTVIAQTDANGMATGEALANDKIVIHIEKPGWYRPYCHHELWGSGKDYLSGRWEPWNPTLDVTMYPKINRRQAPKFRSCYYEHLEQNTVYGFDMLRKDIILSGRKGETADFQFIGSGSKVRINSKQPGESKLFSTNKFEVVFSNDGDGVIKMKRQLDSEFKFTYLAPEAGYGQIVKFSSVTIPQHRESTFLTDDEYLIFRISRKDLNSGKINRYYGIVTRLKSSVNTKGERYFDIEYYLNPTPGDRNIEYGP